MKKSFLIISVLLVLFGTSCKKYLDVNDDPFSPQTAPPNTYLPGILYSMAEGDMFDSRFIGCYTQNWNRVSANYNYDQHGSRVTQGSATDITQGWRNHYWATGSDVNQMVEQAKQRGYGGYEGIGNAVKVWSWQTLTDTHGELPFKEAWDNTRTHYDYDSQKDIYDGVDQLGDEAIAQLDEGGKIDPTLASWDRMYNGDLAKWKKFVYAVKARMALHKSNKPSFNPDQVLEYVSKSFTSNDDNAMVKFDGTSATTASFLGASRGNYGSYYPGMAIVHLLDGTVFSSVIDPRLSLMFSQSSDGSYRGIAPGVGDTATVKAVRMYGKYLFFDDASYPLITYHELQFLKAEAAFIKGDMTTAYAAFLEGIKAHMAFTGVSDTDRDTYLASAAVPQAANNLTLRDILCQKYISMFTQNEIWSDLRKHDYDTNLYPSYIIPATLRPENNGKLVERVVYRQFSEFDWNIDAVEANGATEPDYHTRKLWVFTDQE